MNLFKCISTTFLILSYLDKQAKTKTSDYIISKMLMKEPVKYQMLLKRRGTEILHGVFIRLYIKTLNCGWIWHYGIIDGSELVTANLLTCTKTQRALAVGGDSL